MPPAETAHSAGRECASHLARYSLELVAVPQSSEFLESEQLCHVDALSELVRGCRLPHAGSPSCLLVQRLDYCVGLLFSCAGELVVFLFPSVDHLVGAGLVRFRFLENALRL